MLNNQIPLEFLDIVYDINRKYEGYRSFSSDCLRSKISRISTAICNSSNRSKSMDTFLPDVFAIVKETARRFSEGPIEVTANENDVRVAQENDYVKISEGKAIYSNIWDADGHMQKWQMVHYDEQLYSGILLHRGYAVQMATGEGKTLAATLPVFLNALCHDGVHLMTSNDYLSIRDFELTAPLYELFGLSVGCVELSGWHEKKHKSAYTADITFGSNSTFIFDYLKDHITIDSEKCVQAKHTFAIIDELDSALIDNADEPHIVGGGNLYKNETPYKENIELVRELIALGEEMYTSDPLRKLSSFTDKGRNWIATKVSDTSTVAMNVLDQLLAALTVYFRDVDYVVDAGEIKIIDPYTGRIRENSRWEHGLHTAIEVKEDVKVRPDFDGLAVISVKNYLKLYGKIAGMSGTILSEESELNKTYGIQCAIVPTHLQTVRRDMHPLVYRTKSQKDAAIVKDVNLYNSHGAPILVGCPNVIRAEELGANLQKSGLGIHVLNAKTLSDEAELIASAGINNAITVATSVAGRGTDIKPSKSALEKGGLRIVGTELGISERIDNQLRGRSGRQGNPGSSIFYLSLEDAVLKFLSPEDIDNLRNLTEGMSDKELQESDTVLGFFILAQKNCESYHRERREESARKDDTIAPYRSRFYKNRNGVLHNPDMAENIVRGVIASHGIEAETIDAHINELYERVRTLLTKSQWNNETTRKRQVPFTAGDAIFAAEFDIQQVNVSLEYFRKEYLRQMILHNYDGMWANFVLYVLGNLSKQEIDGLEDRYLSAAREMETAIISCLTTSMIPIGGYSIKDTVQTTGSAEPTPNRKKVILDGDSLCPCGSGKKYRDCHGASHDIKAKRRRR